MNELLLPAEEEEEDEEEEEEEVSDADYVSDQVNGLFGAACFIYYCAIKNSY